MKHIRNFISVSLCLIIVMFTCITSSALDADTSSYVPDYDTETPIVIIHGMSQNNTYLTDEDGQWVKDDSGNYVTGWPLKIEFAPLLKNALLPLLGAIFTQKDCGLADAIKDSVDDALWVIEKDTKGNYVNNISVPCYECPMSELPESVKKEYYTFIPVQELDEIVGEENVYYFGYDSLGDVAEITEHLNYYIHDVVMAQTGAEQVSLCPISLGGTIAIQYLEDYPEDYSLIKKMVFIEPALDGSNVIGDLFTNNLSFYNSDDLYSNILPALFGETPVAYLLNMVLRILPEKVLMGALDGLATGLTDYALRPSTILWALCPDAYYEEARKLWLEDDEYAEIREKVDSFMNARKNFKENLTELMDTGCVVADIVCYNVNLFPICKDYKTTNADRVIHSASTSIGATFADFGTTLGENYKAAGTYCSNPEHNHLSPDGIVDATTGFLPCTTWYFNEQPHEMLPDNDVAIKLAIRIITDNNMNDVYSNPEEYPQFNNVRLVRIGREYIKLWEDTDKSSIPDDKIAAVDEAVAEMKVLLDKTVVIKGEWEAAEEKLENALVAAGVMEDPDPTEFEQIMTTILKGINNGVNSIFKAVNAA